MASSKGPSTTTIVLGLAGLSAAFMVGYFFIQEDEEDEKDQGGAPPAPAADATPRETPPAATEEREVDPMAVIARLKQEAIALQSACDFDGCIKKFRLLSKVQEKVDPQGGSHLWTNIMLAAAILQVHAVRAGQGLKPGEPAAEPSEEGWNLLVESSGALHEIAVDFCEAGELDKAQGLCQQLAKVQAQLLGPQHPNVLQTLSTMGGILAYRGDLKGARELYEAVFSSQISQGDGGEIISKLTALSLGHVLWQQKEFEAASKLLEATEVSFKSQLGQDDLLTILVRVELAMLRMMEGKRGEGEALFALVLAVECDTEDIVKQLDCFIINQGKAWGEEDERVVIMRDASSRLKQKKKNEKKK
ncbi:hypothetical protein TrLO_g4500 [Triparma laevis f. longispina]|uniref:Uncharacterized protein n=1 Tax=Triparma laevis f. longispina TaxID=1714387 RepID=A0A9W7DUR7_9STRA|nr:hypothetical protein TrLO_g4500 [Triparma laevis f. longispina]